MRKKRMRTFPPKLPKLILSSTKELHKNCDEYCNVVTDNGIKVFCGTKEFTISESIKKGLSKKLTIDIRHYGSFNYKIDPNRWSFFVMDNTKGIGILLEAPKIDIFKRPEYYNSLIKKFMKCMIFLRKRDYEKITSFTQDYFSKKMIITSPTVDNSDDLKLDIYIRNH